METSPRTVRRTLSDEVDRDRPRSPRSNCLNDPRASRPRALPRDHDPGGRGVEGPVIGGRDSRRARRAVRGAEPDLCRGQRPPRRPARPWAPTSEALHGSRRLDEPPSRTSSTSPATSKPLEPSKRRMKKTSASSSVGAGLVPAAPLSRVRISRPFADCPIDPIAKWPLRPLPEATQTCFSPRLLHAELEEPIASRHQAHAARPSARFRGSIRPTGSRRWACFASLARSE